MTAHTHPFTGPAASTRPARSHGAAHHTSDQDDPDPAIRLRSIRKHFGDIQALDGVSLDIPRGSIYGLLGPNGAGKTTTIRIALGLLRPDDGDILTLGLNPRTHGETVRRRIGVLLEQDGHYEPMSVQENLEYHGRLHGLSPTMRRRRADEVLDLFGLRETAHRPAGTLSKGMKRKLAIARSLLHTPELVILDEPTTGLDARAVAQLRDDLTRVVKEHDVTLILATHNLFEAERMCDRVAILDHGRLILEGPPHLIGMAQDDNHALIDTRHIPRKALTAMRTTPGVLEAGPHNGDPTRILLRLEGGARLAPALRRAVQAGAQIENVERPRASLEEAFLKATRPPSGDADPTVTHARATRRRAPAHEHTPGPDPTHKEDP